MALSPQTLLKHVKLFISLSYIVFLCDTCVQTGAVNYIGRCPPSPSKHHELLQHIVTDSMSEVCQDILVGRYRVFQQLIRVH